MVDIQLKDLKTLTGLENAYFVLVQDSGEGGKATPALVQSSLLLNAMPRIDEKGNWTIGGEDMGISAKAQNVEMRFVNGTLEWKYANEEDEYYRPLMFLSSEVLNFFESLTDEVRQEKYVLHVENMTEEEIRIIQEPALQIARFVEKEEKARAEVEKGRVEAEQGRVEAEKQRQSNTSAAISNAEKATEDATEVAANPTYVGRDFYIYEYDLATHQYNKTEKLVKAAAFTIDFNFSSMEELLANQPIGLNDNLFAIINTQDTEDEDNAKLFISKNDKWQYVVDMSGFRGFQGYTPQLFKGEVTIGNNRNDGAVTVSENGRDDNNNPKYNINFRLPSFAYDDFTEENIYELQTPAREKAEEVQLEENKRVQAELDRVKSENERNNAEKAREEAEGTRGDNEDARKVSEQERVAKENERDNNESARKLQEEERQEEEKARNEAENKRVSSEKSRQEAENTRTSNEEARESAEKERAKNEETRKTEENARQENEEKREEQENARQVSENAREEYFDAALEQINSFDRRLHNVEVASIFVGDTLGYDDEIDPSIFTVTA